MSANTRPPVISFEEAQRIARERQAHYTRVMVEREQRRAHVARILAMMKPKTPLPLL